MLHEALVDKRLKQIDTRTGYLFGSPQRASPVEHRKPRKEG
jgi:hypothetical protein